MIFGFSFQSRAVSQDSHGLTKSYSYIAVSPWIMSLSSIMMLLFFTGIEFSVVRLPNLAHIEAVIGVTIGLIFGFSFQFVLVRKTQTVATTSYITVSPWAMSLLPVMKIKHSCTKSGFSIMHHAHGGQSFDA